VHFTNLDSASGRFIDLTPLLWVAGTCVTAFLVLIAATLVVALTSGSERAERAQWILALLLGFIIGLLNTIWPSGRSQSATDQSTGDVS
jgi:hypothetical protein